MKTLAGDRVILKDVADGELWTASCEGCGWTYPDNSKHQAAYKGDAAVAARRHARECIGDQGTLW